MDTIPKHAKRFIDRSISPKQYLYRQNRRLRFINRALLGIIAGLLFLRIFNL